eukprot:5933682-Prymnesium_polylepis.1
MSGTSEPTPGHPRWEMRALRPVDTCIDARVSTTSPDTYQMRTQIRTPAMCVPLCHVASWPG